MYKLELNELRELIKNENDLKLRGTLIVLLCLADKVAENDLEITVLDAKTKEHDIFVARSTSVFKIIAWGTTFIQIVVIAFFGYIFETLNTLSIRQAVVMHTLEDVQARNVQVDNQRRAILDKAHLECLP